MNLDKMLDMDLGQLADWLVENKSKYALVPRELNLEVREAFHESMDDHENGCEIEGSPDDQWNAMLEVIDRQSSE